MSQTPPTPPTGPPPSGPPPGPGEPSPAQRPEDRLSISTVIGWTILVCVILAFAQLALTLVLGGATAALGGGTGSPWWLLLPVLVSLAPIAVSIVRLRASRSPGGRSTWLGVLIGSALYLIVMGGMCITLLGAF